MCSVARLYGRLLQHKIEAQIREAEDQNGFKAGGSCAIFTNKQLFETRRERGQIVQLTFIDHEKAYDRH